MTDVTHCKLKSLFEKGQISSNDRCALRKYHQHLKSTVTWLKMIGNTSALRSTDNVTKAVIRLPNEIRKGFYKMNIDEESLNLIHLEQWLDKKLKEFYNPIANIIASEEKGRQKGGAGDKPRSSLSNHLDRQDKDEKKTL